MAIAHDKIATTGQDNRVFPVKKLKYSHDHYQYSGLQPAQTAPVVEYRKDEALWPTYMTPSFTPTTSRLLSAPPCMLPTANDQKK